MPNTPATTDTTDWHKFFAIECNNRAWDLTVKSDRTPDDDAEMLNTAHAAALHWDAIGTELNRMRATMLLAEIHAQLDLGVTALHYAQTMRDFFVEQANSPDWELAFAHTITAHAAATAGTPDEHAASYEKAVAAIQSIADPADRDVVEATFKQVPKP